ncbi:MAG TPA: translation elongation factor G, partial [Lachnospiraceae bacterium]|nr:translation elongation factor G [Lachnospiraceae bacterium]
MGEREPKKAKKHICAGLLAHVDAGKTTLSEGILYTAGVIRKLGRVDNQDAFLDTNDMERERGITIFSKEAVVALGDKLVTLLDTPGHVDFSAEMERTLQVLDYAVLVVSGADGVQGHTATLWRLLERYQVPVFLFINKMDQQGVEEEPLMQEVKEQLSENCVLFREGEESFYEDVAVCDEMLLDYYLENGVVEREQISNLIQARKLFPCYFGSALKLTGVQEFLEGFVKYTKVPAYSDKFGAKVFKIARDEKNSRLTFLKVTGGKLSVKQSVTNQPSASGKEDGWEEKINQIRIYSGEHFETADLALPGTICAVTGLTKTYAGQGLGIENDSELPVLEPVLSYALQLPQGCSPNGFLPKLRILEEEEPELKIVWNETLQEIQAQLMGEVQIEILKRLIWERFHVDVHFGAGKIVYKETIQNSVEGVGHFEPLRHYAEVHLFLEPGETGSGVQIASVCSEDSLNRNWQRLICTHLAEREHPGVLLGAALTDIRITLVAGKAHLKHTEGGDFRQATYRAVRQGLMKAESVLLEPYYEYCLEVPNDMLGKAMSDIERFQGSFQPPEQAEQLSILRGTAPVATMRNYQQEVLSYTKGLGRLNCSLKGYFPCHNTEEVLSQSAYDPEADIENPTGSVFCSHGAGF